jgi:uncharacterized protein with PIN domain
VRVTHPVDDVRGAVRDAAALNLGDSIAYAAAKAAHVRLLYVGED